MNQQVPGQHLPLLLLIIQVGPAQMAQLNQQMSKMIDPGVLKQMGGTYLRSSPHPCLQIEKKLSCRHEWSSKHDETNARQCWTRRGGSHTSGFCSQILLQVPDMAQMENMMKKMGARRKQLPKSFVNQSDLFCHVQPFSHLARSFSCVHIWLAVIEAFCQASYAEERSSNWESEQK